MTVFEMWYLGIQALALLSWVALPVGLWKLKEGAKTKFLIGVMVLNLALGIFHYWDQKSVPTENQSTAQGDFWDIETIFQADPSVTSRVWKRNILDELLTNLNQYRVSQNLVPVESGVVESFSPSQLYSVLESDPSAVVLLDVREAYERRGYHLPNSTAYRYGDLANNIEPSISKDQKVVVICYSGIRGFLVANLLKQLGYEQTAFIRGGLEAWYADGIPAAGDYHDFTFLGDKYERLSQPQAELTGLKAIDFRAQPDNGPRYSNAVAFSGELATSAQVQTFMESLDQAEVLLVCETESECYDARMFAYNYEALGGTIRGYSQF